LVCRGLRDGAKNHHRQPIETTGPRPIWTSIAASRWRETKAVSRPLKAVNGSAKSRRPMVGPCRTSAGFSSIGRKYCCRLEPADGEREGRKEKPKNRPKPDSRFETARWQRADATDDADWIFDRRRRPTAPCCPRVDAGRWHGPVSRPCRFIGRGQGGIQYEDVRLMLKKNGGTACSSIRATGGWS